MLWKGRRESGNVELGGGGGGIGGTGLALGGGGCGTLIIIILALLFGVDPSSLLNGTQQVDPNPPQQTQNQPTTQNQSQQRAGGRNESEMEQFVRVVVADTEDIWRAEFRKIGKTYQDPKLVLFNGQVRSACGFASAATGPFYCPADAKVYLDTSFFRELQTKFRASGDFAQAYVIAHEIGHHVQNLLGTSDKVDRAQSQARSKGEANQYSVALELQADCYAGIYAHDAAQKGILEAGDVEEALRAASAVGDDNIQKQTQGYVVPDSFTHGSSQQRSSWFNRGYQSGDMKQCNTFAAR
ncbi:MAG: neutral zinc metallopeptidase [Pyrinomonadaceae bacterium]